MKHKIGEIYEVNGGKYKLVEGESCESCYLRNKDEICQMMPPCEQHKGHYVKVDAGEKVVLNLPDVSQQRELLRAYEDFKQQPHHDGAFNADEFIEMYLARNSG